MKRFFLLSFFVLLSAVLIFAQSPSIGGFNVYYGHLHNHSNLTDGNGSPEYAYEYAKNNAGLDFFSLGDHAEALTANEYKRMKKAANAANEDGVYTTFYSFEWSGVTHGHVLVVNADDYCTSLQSATNSFGKFIDWLSVRECVAIFNHPGRHDVVGNEFLHFNYKPIEQMVGMELWNKNDAFNRYYYNNGYYSNDENRGYFDEAIARGWKIGASGADDNHGGNWGTRNDYRMAILSTKLTRNDLYAALKARRFYSTLDKNLALSFKIDGNEMGSTIVGGDSKININ
ncbi:MAG: CehA/McbA family metallohydrolase, partial [Bacteroidales bacterium]|nr:CehA/McbA family metallohydrolase [Bacteroidales bacterium]